MKKRITKKGWLLGVLVGLVMLVGVAPAMAAYIFVGNFYDNTFASYDGSPNPDTWTSLSSNPTYEYDGNNEFYVAGEKQTRNDYSGLYADWPGGWGPYEYVIIKQGSYGANPNSNPCVDLYKYSATGTDNDLPNLGKYWDDGDNEYKISHITGYNQVPIPGAVWLFSSGLGLLFIRRRRKL